jgi:hypothetical protein
MEGNTFDRIIRNLATGSTRRRVLGGVIGSTAAVLAGAAVLEAKPKGKGKRNGKGKKKGQNGNNGGGGGAGTEKVFICHRNNGRKGYTLIEVGAPAVPAHERHGDTVCETRECFVPVGCEDGECTYAVDEGASCDEFAPAAGRCNAEGLCEALPPAPEE